MFGRKKKKEPINEPPKERHLEKKMFYVRGTGYYQDNFEKLTIPNPDWDSTEPGKHYKYNFKKKPLVLDEDPEYPGSIRISIDGLKIGVLSNEDAAEMREIQRGEVKYISAIIHGGPSKDVTQNGNVFEDDKMYVARISVGYIVEK